MSHFAFLQAEWPALFESASKAKALALPDASTDAHVRDDVTALLHAEVSSMNTDNFVVRARRRVVEKYARRMCARWPLQRDTSQVFFVAFVASFVTFVVALE